MPARRVLAAMGASAVVLGAACGSTQDAGTSGSQDGGGGADGAGIGADASSSGGSSGDDSGASSGTSSGSSGASSGSSSGSSSSGGSGAPSDGAAGSGDAARDALAGDAAPPPCIGSTYSGDLSINTAADLAAAQSIVCVNGSLLIYYQSTTTISFAALRGVTGNVLDSSDPSTPSLSFPMLVSAGGLELTQDTALATVSAPSLTTLGTTGLSIHDDPALATLDIGSLATMAGDISIVNDATLTAFSVPYLQSTGGIDIQNDTALTQLDLSGVTQALALDVQGNDMLGRVDMPLVTSLNAIAITTIKGAALTAATLSSLTTAQHIDIEGASLAQIDLHALQTTNSLLVSGGPGLTSLDLPALTSSAIDVFAANLTSLNLPNLTTATDFTVAVMNGPLDVSVPKLTDASGGVAGYGIIFDYPGVRSLSAPVLTKVLSIRVGGSSLTTLSLPQLVSANDLTIEYSSTLQSISLPLLTTLSSASRVDNDTVLAMVSLPSMTSGGLLLSTNPVLTSVDMHQLQTGTVQINKMPVTSFSAPAMTTGTLDFESDPALTSLSFPAFTAADANGITIAGDPMLTSVTTPLLTAAGQLYVVGTGLTNLGPFAGLGALQGNLRVNSNPALTDVTALDGLKSVGGAFDFENNTSLHTANVTALRDTIGVANIHGTITISGNAP